MGDVDRTDTEWYINVTEKRKKQRRIELNEAAPAVLAWIEMAELTEHSDWPLFPAIAPDKVSIVN